MLEKVDKILEGLVDITYNEIQKTSNKNYFSKDFIEACRNCSFTCLWKVGKQ